VIIYKGVFVPRERALSNAEGSCFCAADESALREQKQTRQYMLFSPARARTAKSAQISAGEFLALGKKREIKTQREGQKATRPSRLVCGTSVSDALAKFKSKTSSQAHT
jgi:hypothetical protein